LPETSLEHAMSPFDRRDFIRRSLVAGAGAAALGRFPRMAGARPVARKVNPIIITSHTNATGQEAARQAWAVLAAGGTAMDAVEKGANIVEVDPDDHSVGFGGLPNADGVVQLDASCMDGKTYSAGSVGCLENIKTPSSVARAVMEHTDHVMLVGVGALEFAKSMGFKEENLLTDEARAIWIQWRESLAESDAYGPPVYLRSRGRAGGSGAPAPAPVESHHGTVNVLAVDAHGDVAGITTTSGLSWKIPGRVGDSPIIGAGLYVDNSVGAAGATGRGEDVMKSLASYFIVGRMRDGRSPQQACEDAVEMIVGRYRAVGIDYVPGEKFVALSRDGEVGCSFMGGGGGPPALTMHTPEGQRQVQGTSLYPSKG
jgi:N4-(beta-N-acetylglucosaminyl)-L-asparaginase